MTHLSDAELVDAAERTLVPARRVHLDSCERCRAAVRQLESVLRDVPAADVPEPSPLFWDRLSARVHDAVAGEEPAASRWDFASLRAPWIQIAAVCAMVIAVASAAWFVRPSGERTPTTTVASPMATQAAAASSPDLADVDDPAWAVLSAVAADMSPEVTDAETPSSALTVRPAAVDTAVQQLTPRERQELGRLLQSEMKRSSD